MIPRRLNLEVDINMPEEYLYLNLSENITKIVKSAPGLLHSVVINNQGLGSNKLYIYNNTEGSGEIIGIIDTTVSTIPLIYDVIFTVGLTVVSSDGVSANITITYK